MRAPLLPLALTAVALLAGCGGGSRSAPSTTTSRVAHVRENAAGGDPSMLGPVNRPRPARPRRLPPLRACRRPIRADLEMAPPRVAGGADCSTARHIAIRVTRAAWERCDPRCIENYPIGFGYRCDGFAVGEAAWSVDCRRGRRLVHLAITD
jgi:hypothetical protein